MDLLPLNRLTPGMILISTIRKGDKTLFRAGHTLTQADINTLKGLGLRSVHIRSGVHTPVVNEKLQKKAVDEVKKIYLEYENLTPQTMKVLRDLGGGIVKQVMASQELSLHINDLKEFDEYLFRHSVNVTIIAAALGKLMNLNENDLFHLATGTLLHDIGKMKVPQEILYKKGELTNQEMHEMQRHPEYGLDIVQERLGGSPHEWGVVYQHHESVDGSGYPKGKKGPQIHSYSKLVKVADMYDALRSDRPYKDGWPPHHVMALLHSPSIACTLDPEALAVLDSLVVRFHEGAKVMLSDGRSAEVVDGSKEHKDRPIIKTAASETSDEETIDLLAHDELLIISVDRES